MTVSMRIFVWPVWTGSTHPRTRTTSGPSGRRLVG
jgi:hypothetical protein